MDDLLIATLRNMERTLGLLESRVPAPQRVDVGGKGFVFRYVERTIQQAIIQKLARIVSGLHAARLLLEKGFVQELGAQQRMLDEFQEDAIFLAYAVIFNDVTELHQKYLEAFWMEEFTDPSDPMGSQQKRPMISRDKVRAQIARFEGAELDPSTGIAVTRSVSKTYSGFVHAASPHCMEMYGGDPPHFHVRGLLGSPRVEEHRDDLIEHYFYRSVLSFGFAAKAFGDDELFASIIEFRGHFEQTTGQTFRALKKKN